MNVKPMNYSWTEFYDNVIDLGKYTFSWRAIYNRLMANKTMIPKWMNVVRAISAEGFGRVKYNIAVRKLLNTDSQFRNYFEGETNVLPQFYIDQVKKNLGPLWHWLPKGALYHDPNAYLKSTYEIEEKAIAV